MKSVELFLLPHYERYRGLTEVELCTCSLQLHSFIVFIFDLVTFPTAVQATLLGDLSGQELETMVSTTELQKTSGTVRTHTFFLPASERLCS